ncbi:MAG: hypothetical protein H7336_00380 [Bacteriovorax sp.]|nr:hypothetical protein [Bacteriovorax sp.]
MKRIKNYSSLLLLTLLSTSAFALQCPDKSNTPYCPSSGSTLLDETYPTQAFVISNQPMLASKEARAVTQKFVSKVISNYDYKNVPQIILPMTKKSDYDELVANIKNSLVQKKIPADEVEKIIGQITMGPAQSYTWQQDWFESFVDLKTGSPVVRQIESYYVRVPAGSGEVLASSGNKCSITNGETIKSAYSDNPYASMADIRKNENSFGSGEMGGNIEGAPGGFCLAGDNQGKSFTKQFCGDEKNVITLQTSWLSVGHVDELFKIMPTHYNDGRPKECEFSLMAASPKKALSLMSTPGTGNIPFYDIDDKNPEIDLKATKQMRSKYTYAGNSHICTYMQSVMSKRPNLQSQPTAVKSVFLKLFFSDAVAQDNQTTNYTYQQLLDNCENNIDQVSNYEMQEVMKQDKDFMDLQIAIDQSIEADKASIKEKILSRLPQCAKYYNEIDVPDLFYGAKVITNADGKLELKKPGTVDSFLPNPTNSVLMNKTLTFSDSGNKLFNNYMTEELSKRKMKADFISTWDYAHIGHGNIHCSSHSIPYCKPQRPSR